MNRNIKRFVDYDVKCCEGVKIKIKNMTSSDMEKSYDRIRPNAKDKKKGEMKIEWDMDFIFKCMIVDVKDLTITDEDGKVVEIKTADDILYNPGLDDLYLELSGILLSMSARVDAKN